MRHRARLSAAALQSAPMTAQPHPGRSLARRHRRIGPPRRAGRRRRRRRRARGAGRHRAADLPALGGQGAAGAAAGGQRRRRRAAAQRRRTGAGLRLARRRAGARAPPPPPCWPRPASTRARWSAARTGPTTRPSSASGRARRDAERAAQQLLGQTRRLRLPGLPAAPTARDRARLPARLRAARPPGDARGDRRAAGRHRLRPVAHAPRGTDGCSIPTYAIPLRHLAQAFARVGTGVGLRADARARRAAPARRRWRRRRSWWPAAAASTRA